MLSKGRLTAHGPDHLPDPHYMDIAIITAPIVAARLRAYMPHTEGSATRVIKALQASKLIGKATRGGPPDRAARLDAGEAALLAVALVMPPMALPVLVNRAWEVFSLGHAEHERTAGDALVNALSNGTDIGEIVIGISTDGLYVRMGTSIYGTAPDAETVRHETIIGRDAAQAMAVLVQAANEG